MDIAPGQQWTDGAGTIVIVSRSSDGGRWIVERDGTTFALLEDDIIRGYELVDAE